MVKNIKQTMLVAFMLCAGAAFGLTSCNEGTSPGDTNVERSGIRDTEANNTGSNASGDTTENLERHYDHADHENHNDNEGGGGAVNAGDGKQEGTDRGEVNQ